MSILEEINNKDTVRIFTAPEPTVVPGGYKALFLAGSIEMDTAEKWQDTTAKKLVKEFDNIIVFNPRREAWDSSWKQEVSNKNFYGQVDWEHQNIVDADFIFIYFQKDTKSPISLLELGLVAGLEKKTLVCCPKGFWRRGNVEYICERYNIEMVDSLDDLPAWLKKQKGVK